MVYELEFGYCGIIEVGLWLLAPCPTISHIPTTFYPSWLPGYGGFFISPLRPGEPSVHLVTPSVDACQNDTRTTGNLPFGNI